MPRSANGTCTLAADPFTPNTAISSSAMNADLSDIAGMLTDSLSRSGQGFMTATLSLANSGLTYASDTDTGLLRTAANTQAIRVGGSDWTFSQTDITDPLGSPVGPMIGEIRMWMLPNAPSGWVLLFGQPCTSTYPLQRAALIAAGNPYGVSGSDPLFPDLRCAVPAGKADMGGVNRGLLTGGATLGAFFGTQTVALTSSQLPSITPSGSISAITPSGTVATTITNGTSVIVNTAGASFGGGPVGGTVNLVATSTFTGTPSTPTFTGTPFGGNQDHSNVQPTIILQFIARAA